MAELLQSIAVPLDDILFGPVLEDVVAGTKRREVHFCRIPHVVIWIATLDFFELSKSPQKLVVKGLIGSHTTHHRLRSYFDHFI